MDSLLLAEMGRTRHEELLREAEAARKARAAEAGRSSPGPLPGRRPGRAARLARTGLELIRAATGLGA